MRPFLLLAVVAATVTDVSSLTCRSECVKPSSLSFCGEVLSFPGCPSGLSPISADQDARRAFEAFSNSSLSAGCALRLKRYECLKRFPICEYGNDYSLLCTSACDSVVDSCGASTVPLSRLNCNPDSGGLSDGVHCFDMDYNGPNRTLWVIGFLINVVFSFCAALGLNLQKQSLHEHPADKPPFSQRKWLLGFSLIVMGSLLDFVAFGLAPQSFLAPLAALSLVWNMFLAPRFHGEQLTRQNLVATGVICVGVTITVIFSSHSTPTYLLADLIALYQKPVMYAFVCIVGVVLVAMFMMARHLERAGQTGGLLHIVCYGGLAGSFGGFAVTLAKSTVELLKSTWAGGNAFNSLLAYLIVIAMACCLLSQISFLNAGLRQFDALVMVPVYQAFWIMMSIMGGLVYFEEYTHLDAAQKFMFVLGSAVTVAGIGYLLRTRRVSAEVSGGGGSLPVSNGGGVKHLSPQPTPPRVPGSSRKLRLGGRRTSGPAYSPLNKALEMAEQADGHHPASASSSLSSGGILGMDDEMLGPDDLQPGHRLSCGYDKTPPPRRRPDGKDDGVSDGSSASFSTPPQSAPAVIRVSSRLSSSSSSAAAAAAVTFPPMTQPEFMLGVGRDDDVFSNPLSVMAVSGVVRPRSSSLTGSTTPATATVSAV